MADICRHNARHPVLPAPKSPYGATLPVSPFVSPSTWVTAQAQDHICWTNLLLGQLAADWLGLQHYHLSSISSYCTSTFLAAGVVTHLLAISHSLWVFQNCVVHDQTMEGFAHAAELQVAEDFHTQFVLGLQDLPFSEQYYIKDTLWIPSCMPP